MKQLRDSKGFTLIELVVVFALIALVMVGVVYSISKGRQTGQTQKVTSDLRTVETGLFQYKTYKGTLPQQATMGAFPAALNAYVSAELRAVHKYQCDTTNNKAVIRTPAMSSSSEATDVATMLQDSGLCSSAVANADKTIDCTLKSFDGSANCT